MWYENVNLFTCLITTAVHDGPVHMWPIMNEKLEKDST